MSSFNENKFNDFTDNNNEKHELISKISTKEKCLNCCQTHMIALRNILNELQNKNSDKENNELMIVAPRAPIKAKPVKGTKVTTPLSEIVVFDASHMFVKFSANVPVRSPIANPSTISANKANSFAEVKIS